MNNLSTLRVAGRGIRMERSVLSTKSLTVGKGTSRKHAVKIDSVGASESYDLNKKKITILIDFIRLLWNTCAEFRSLFDLQNTH